MSEWWTFEQGNLIGAIAGSTLGVLGAVIGTSLGVFANKGMLKRFNYTLVTIVLASCAASLIVGVVGVIGGQPFHVWFPLVLIGVVGCSSLSGAYFLLPRIYGAAERRRLDAEQFRRA